MIEGYKFSTSGLYRTIAVDPESPHGGYMAYIDSLPMNPHPEAFGMHANANITSDQNETYELFDILLSLQVIAALALHARAFSCVRVGRLLYSRA
jgi:dynein heavy chain